MKNMKDNITFGIALVCVMLFTACDNFYPPKIHTPVEGDYGRISISFAGGKAAPYMAEPQTARTVLPSTVFDKYVYTFTKTGEETGEVEIPDDSGFFTLEVGEYTVAVQAFIGTVGSETLAATGESLPFSVGPSNNDTIEVLLSGVDTGVTGEFSYTITFPAGAEAEITLKKWPGLDVITLTPENLTQINGITETLELEAGSYMLTISIRKNGLYAGKSEAVHIHPYLPTEYTAVFDEDSIVHVLLSSITAEYTQTGTVYNNTPLDNLKADITVTAHYDNGTTRILPSFAYSLSGTLSSGTSTVTVSHTEGNVTKTETFTVTVTQAPAAGLYGKAPPILASDNPVNFGSGWAENIVDRAIQYVNSFPNKTYTLVLDTDIDVAGGGRVLRQSGAKLIIVSFGAERKIRLTSRGNMFTIGESGQTGIELTIGEDITLEGLTSGVNGATQDNNTSVVNVQGGVFTMQDNTIVSGNTSSNSSYGGGVYVYDGSFIMRDNALVTGNTAYTCGGVYVAYRGTFTMRDNALVTGNTASNSNYAGGVYVNNNYYNWNGYFDLNNVLFTMQGNASVTNNIGNGVYVHWGSFTMQESASVTYNRGRGVYVGSGSILRMQGSASVSDNNGSSYAGSPLSVDGGGVSIDGGEFRMQGGIISQNIADNGGGVNIIGGGVFTMSGGSISSNTARNYGGGLRIGSSSSLFSEGSSGTFTMRGGTIYNNNTASFGESIVIYYGSTAKYGDGTTIAAPQPNQILGLNNIITGRP